MGYTYDPVGNVSTISGMSGSPTSGFFSYDAADRLTTASGPWGSGSVIYSGSGNISYKQLGTDTLSYSYACCNHVTSITQNGTSSAYSYDQRGNVTDNGRNQFVYDNASSLTCVDCGLPTETRYGYDGKGWRVWQQKSGVKTYFHHATNGDLLFEFSTLGNKWKQHVYLAGKRLATRTADPAPTTTSLATFTGAACESNSQLGVLQFLRATVTPSTATGTVTFIVLEGLNGTASVLGGVATLLPNDLLPGSNWSVRAHYSGDDTYAPSDSASIPICVEKYPVFMTMTTSPSNPRPGDTLAVRVDLSVNNAGTPTGAVDLTLDSGTPLRGTLSNGIVVINVTGLTGGTHTLTAHYLGDSRFKENTITASVTVTGPAVSLTLPRENDVFLVGRPITLAATASGGSGTIANVAFQDGGGQIASLNSGPYTYPWTAAALGNHTLTASATDGGNGTTVSPPVHIRVRNAGPTVTVSGSAMTQQTDSSSCTYTQISEDVSGNWNITCGAGTKTVRIFPALSGAVCAAYASITEDVNGGWTVNGCISP